MLNEIRLEEIPNGQLVITDNDPKICNLIKIACNIIKKNLFDDSIPKEYIISINSAGYYNKKIEYEITFNNNKNYYFEYTVSNIDEYGKEYYGEICIDESGKLISYRMNESLNNKEIIDNDEYKVKAISIYDTNYSLDISSSATVDGNMLKFNDENIKASVINNLKNKIKPYTSEQKIVWKVNINE